MFNSAYSFSTNYFAKLKVESMSRARLQGSRFNSMLGGFTLSNMPTYDKAKFHFDEGAPSEAAHIHIGFFLGWAIQTNLASEWLLTDPDSSPLVERFKHRQLTAAKLLEEVADGVLDDQTLNTEGRRFADYYYTNGRYLPSYYRDYREVFPEFRGRIPPVTANTWESFDKMARRIDEVYGEWIRLGRPDKPTKKRAWWRIFG